MNERAAITANDVISGYTDEKREMHFYYHPWGYFFAIPMSFALAAFFIRHRFTANGVTLLSGLILLSGIALIATSNGSYIALIAGAICINGWYVLDFVDGHVARYTKTVSAYGALLDTMFGHLFHVLVPIAVGTAMLFIGSYEGYGTIPLLAGLAIAMFSASRSAISKQIVLKRMGMDNERKTREAGKVGRVAHVAYAIESSKSPALLVFALVGALHFWLLLYLIASSLWWAYALARVVLAR